MPDMTSYNVENLASPRSRESDQLKFMKSSKSVTRVKKDKSKTISIDADKPKGMKKSTGFTAVQPKTPVVAKKLKPVASEKVTKSAISNTRKSSKTKRTNNDTPSTPIKGLFPVDKSF